MTLAHDDPEELRRTWLTSLVRDPSDVEDVRRAQVVVVGSTLLVIVGVAFVIRYAALGVPLMAASVALTVAGALLNLVALRWTQRPAIAGGVATTLLYGLIFVSNVASGGFYDPNFVWFYVIPIGAAVMVGPRAGAAYSALIFVTAVGFYLAGPLETLIPPSEQAQQSLANRLSAVLAIAALLGAFAAAQRAMRKQLLKEIDDRRAAEREARAAAEAKDAFLASMSHELRTPLNGVLGVADLLAETELDAGQAEYAKTIRRSGRALLAVLNDILDFSKIAAGKLELQDVDYAPRDLASDVDALFRPHADQQGLSLVVEVDASVPEWIFGAELRVRQVLSNLLGNALKFTKEGEVRLSIAVEGGTLIFRVRDTGAGIDSGSVDRLFKPFEQLDPSHGATGTGLGSRSVIASRDSWGARCQSTRRWAKEASSRFASPLWKGSPALDPAPASHSWTLRIARRGTARGCSWSRMSRSIRWSPGICWNGSGSSWTSSIAERTRSSISKRGHPPSCSWIGTCRG